MNKCNNTDAQHFVFEMPVNQGRMFCGNLTVEGFGCLENDKAAADIDRVEYEGVDVKPLLELMGGMKIIDAAAEQHVKELLIVTI